MTKLLKSIIYIIILGLALSSCSEKQKIRIGVSQCSDDDWRRKMNEEIMREAMFNENVDVEIRSADDNSEKQIADLKYFVDNDFDIIIVSPNEAHSLTEPINEIYRSGRPIIVFDRTIENDGFTAFQGADNYQIGRNVAEYISKLPFEPRILEIRGLSGSSPAELRHEGFIAGVDSLVLDVYGEAYGDWNYDDARDVVDSLLHQIGGISVIYAHNDRMAIAAADAAREAGYSKMAVIGIDAAPSIGMKAVADSVIMATFPYPTNGDRLIQTALTILKGEPYQKYNIIPSGSPVTLDNAEMLIRQDEALRNETSKISVLQAKISTYLHQYTLQKTLLVSSFVILALLAVIIFTLLNFYWSSRRHKAQMEARNEELKKQRDELEDLYQRLQEATGSRLAWFTNVSHDLRTPLTLIAEPIHQILDADNLTERQRTQMQLADSNVKRLQRLVNQILDIRKFDSGQLSLNMANVDLTESVRNWVASFEPVAVRRHLNMKLEIPEGLSIVTALDLEKTERVFFNLLSNAFKFTPENGTITISLERVGDKAVMKVADTGRGISVDDIKHVFERFFRTEAVNPNGSGIGLALSKVFIDMQGGSIDVESTLGEGSVFTVTLPITATDGADTVTSTSTVDTTEFDEVEDDAVHVEEDTPAILVIDDNRDICTLVKSILSDHYTVITATSGAQGIRLANRYIPDLIISDVMMPGTDGYQVCRTLKGEELTAHIPVLLLTACGLDEQRIEGYNCGADAYMSKPFSSEMLLSRCRSLIENRQLVYRKAGDSPAASSAPTPAADITVHATEDEFIVKFIKIVEDNIANSDLSVEDLADMMGLSRVQLYRKIKALTNYSVAELVRNIRLKRAAYILKTSSSTVSEVAYAVGFSSPNYFTRCYKDFFGESPSDTHRRIFSPEP